MLNAWMDVRRKIKKGIVSLTAIAVLVILIIWSYAMTNPSAKEGTARVIISLNYGQEVLVDRVVSSGISALDALKSVANVTTAYGGGFVSGINGIMSDSTHKIDWFYYINGILANVGASQYILRDGDIMRWDYHHWDSSMIINAEIEDFPEPLVHGYAGKKYATIIAYENGYDDIAALLYKHLKNEVKVYMKEASELEDWELKNDNIIVVGANISVAREINRMYRQLGFYYHLENGVVRDIEGNSYAGGFAEISQSPYNPGGTWACENVIILISGNSHTFMLQCAEKLINHELNDFWCFTGEKA